jgi:hypothetical protein
MTSRQAVAAWFGLGRSSCATHRSALLALLDGWPRDEAATARALDHLDRCDACREEMGEYVLILAGLRRLGAASRRTGPGAGGWSRVRARIQAPPNPRIRPRWAGIAGLVAVPLVAAMVLVSGLSAAATGMDPAGGMAGSAGVAAQGAPLAVGVVDLAQHTAALQRAFRISDAAMAPDTVEADAIAEVVPSPATSGVPRGPLPDGMAILSGRAEPSVTATESAGQPVAPAVVPE